MHQIVMTHHHSFPLRHNGQCHILAVTPQRTLIVEEYYDKEFVAQHHLQTDGSFIDSSDENSGTSPFRPLPIPDGSDTTDVASSFPMLEYIPNAPHRGTRTEDRIDSLVYPLTVMEKMQMSQRFRLPCPAPMLIGLSESRVLSSVRLPDAKVIVCRRLRFAYALATPRITPRGERIDYETQAFYLLQHIDPAADLTPLSLDGICGQEVLHQPTQCILCDDLLYVADSGGQRLNSIHIYRI